MLGSGGVRLGALCAAALLLVACSSSNNNSKANNAAATQAASAAATRAAATASVATAAGSPASPAAGTVNGEPPGKSASGKQPLGTGQLDPSKSTIKVPYITYVTGPAAPVATAELQGAKAYVDWLNAHGGVNGHKLELEIQDDASDPSQDVNIYRKDADDKNALVVALGGLNSIAFKPISDELKLACVCLPGTSDIDTPVAKYMFNSEATAEDFHPLLLQYAQKQGWHTVGLLHNGLDYDNAWTKVWKEQGAKYGIKVIAEEQFALSDTQFTTQLTKLRDAKPDFIMTVGANPAIFQEIKQLGITVPILSDHPSTVPSVLQGAGDAAVGVIATQPKAVVYKQVLQPSDPQYFQDDLFTNEYKKQTTQPIDAFSAFGWSLMHITAEALRRAEDNGKLNRDGVRDAIESINGDLVTAMGKISYSPTKHRGVGVEAYTVVKIGPNSQYIPVPGF